MQAVQVEAPVSRRVSRPAGHWVHTLGEMMEGRKLRRGLQDRWHWARAGGGRRVDLWLVSCARWHACHSADP